MSTTTSTASSAPASATTSFRRSRTERLSALRASGRLRRMVRTPSASVTTSCSSSGAGSPGRRSRLDPEARVVPREDALVGHDLDRRRSAPCSTRGVASGIAERSVRYGPVLVVEQRLAPVRGAPGSSTMRACPVTWTARSSAHRSPDSTRNETRGSWRTRCIFFVCDGALDVHPLVEHDEPDRERDRASRRRRRVVRMPGVRPVELGPRLVTAQPDAPRPRAGGYRAVRRSRRASGRGRRRSGRGRRRSGRGRRSRHTPVRE